MSKGNESQISKLFIRILFETDIQKQGSGRPNNYWTN